ncbi:ubiquitin-protein ligase [Fistulina hepatica ATCC 64428]|uniref:Anaphase-promoting complex subunit 2 n=1 Tax=Fistulina hepatica ATCC 64428 TaxID=1128425 RepID=A0A0D7AIF2_9AGAR|nr:ubiquitin-protein ligase [Fistulina hepatica ATCC 64428]
MFYSDDIRSSFKLVKDDICVFMQQYKTSGDPADISRLIYRLVAWLHGWAPPKEMGPTMNYTYQLAFQTNLFAALPPEFSHAFKMLCTSTLDKRDKTLWGHCELLGLVDRYEAIIAGVGYDQIENHIISTYTGQWEKPVLDELRMWMSSRIVPWMVMVYARGSQNAEEARNMLQGIGSRFDFHMNKTLCDLRTKEIFDIIIDYPDSTGALLDLKECLSRVDQRNLLVQNLRKQNRKRLLHPGADTRLILTQYVATIKCLRIVDPPGVLLFKVADPIRRYLRERPDTIRSIVANLVGDDENGDSLVDESDVAAPIHQLDPDDFNDPNWEPEPVDAGPEFRTNKPSDIISTLVSIYDSKDLFIKELQVLLAQRLLAISDDGAEKEDGGRVDATERVDKERRNIEILKIRFGETALQVCEVMLRDMSDSKRIDNHVQSKSPSVVHPTIISRHFWPSLESSDIVMPGQFRNLQEQYAREFTTFKPDKRLRWLPYLGTVHIELELEDRKVDVEVPPLEAAFIELFSTKGTWSVEELIAGVGSVDRTAALRALATWIDLGVLKEDKENVFRLLERTEERDPNARDPVPRPAVTTEQPPVMSVQQQQAEQMRVYWNFIEGMLTNLGALPIDRIQTMLKLAPGYDQTVDQLANFLEAARREGLLVRRDELWKLNK